MRVSLIWLWVSEARLDFRLSPRAGQIKNKQNAIYSKIAVDLVEIDVYIANNKWREQMTKPSSMRDYENDGFVGLVYSDDGLKIVDRTATYNKRIDAFKAAKSLSDHYNSGGDKD